MPAPIVPLPQSFPTPCSPINHLHKLTQPLEPLPISLPHDHTTHEHLNRPDSLHAPARLALPCRLIQSQAMPELVLGHGFGVVDLVAEDQKGHFGELFEVEEFVEGVFGFGEALGVFGVDEVHDAVDFGEVLGTGVSEAFWEQGSVEEGVAHRAISCVPGDGRPGQRL